MGRVIPHPLTRFVGEVVHGNRIRWHRSGKEHFGRSLRLGQIWIFGDFSGLLGRIRQGGDLNVVLTNAAQFR